MSAYGRSEAYRLFREWVAQQRVNISTGGYGEKEWRYYDYGPKDAAPLIFLAGASGTAEVFFKQFVSLCPKGYRIISAEFGFYDTHESFGHGLDRFMDKLCISAAHFFGTSLGGFLVQYFAKMRPTRVLSLILNNTFCDTQFFHDNAPCAPMFALMPEFMLKRIVLQNFPTQKMEQEMANSVDFMVEQLESLGGAALASRLILNTQLSDLAPGDLQLSQDAITIIDTLDDTVLPENVHEEIFKFYPEARVAQLKTGGNFPYLSRSEEVNMHIEVHLRKHGLMGSLTHTLAQKGGRVQEMALNNDKHNGDDAHSDKNNDETNEVAAGGSPSESPRASHIHSHTDAGANADAGDAASVDYELGAPEAPLAPDARTEIAAS